MACARRDRCTHAWRLDLHAAIVKGHDRVPLAFPIDLKSFQYAREWLVCQAFRSYAGDQALSTRASISGTRTRLTRGRPPEAPHARSCWSIASHPPHVTSPATRACSQASTASPPPSGGFVSRPRARSSSSPATVSAAHFLFVPMTPDGPRLIQPTAYSPTRGVPSSSHTRPPSLRIRPRSSSNGTPGS